MLSACLLGACAAATPARPRAAKPERQPVAPVAEAAPPEPTPPPPPKPLGPLREFTSEEWRRIRRVQRYVLHAAKRRRLSPSLINGMIWVESKFERRARGRRGPRGLLQLMPRTAREMARRLRRKYMPYSADFSIDAGTEYLGLMLEQFDGDLHLALAAYNVGPANVTEWLRGGAQQPKPRLIYVMHVERAARAFCDRLPNRRHEPDSGPFLCEEPEAPPELEDDAPEPQSEPGSEDAAPEDDALEQAAPLLSALGLPRAVASTRTAAP